MDNIKLEILGLSSSQTHTGSFTLILGEEDGSRRLPIVIGMFEAQAIAIEIENIVVNRPMTHDLFKAFSNVFEFSIDSVVIHEFSEGVFYSNIICSNGGNTYQIDARPSDAIAIGLRFKVPIYTNETVLSEAGIAETEPKKAKKTTEKAATASKATVKSSQGESIKDMTADQLKVLLDEALKKEDYERAAAIRDELNRRN